MEKLCTVHESLRARIAADVAAWDQTIIGMFDRARAAFGEQLPGLAVVAEERDDEGDYLEVENQGFDNLSHGYVTGYVRRPPQP
jgi:hypothetical protein